MTTILETSATVPRENTSIGRGRVPDHAARQERRSRMAAWVAFLLAYLLVAGLLLVPADYVQEAGPERQQIAVVGAAAPLP